MRLLHLAAGAALFASSALAVDPIEIKGSKFFYSSNDTQFFLRGVAYQKSTTADPLSSKTTCERDIPYMKELRTNVIRTYDIDPTADHDDCMQLLADAGIYVIADLSNTSVAIDRSDPAWQLTLYNRYTSVIDAMAGYNNTLGFFAGNEIANSVGTTDAMPYVKAAIRDMKTYISNKGYRTIGVGYATADVSSIRADLADYINCQSESVGIDFFGYNIYSWCGDSTYAESGYKSRTEEFANYSVPVFFSEYGCNSVTPRTFTEVAALYGDTMSQVWSGGIVYEYFQDTNDYGLVSVIDSTSAKASPLPPTPDSDLCECMVDAATCTVKDSLDSDDIGDLMGEVCGMMSCSGITGNGTTGKYGAYSMCNSKQQLVFVLNEYYEKQKSAGNAASACSWGGSATTKSATSATGSCKTYMSEAGTAGTGLVTSEATATAGSSGSTASSTSVSSTSAGAKAVHVGYFQLAVYVAVAVVSGFAMIML
ncbi:Fungal specific transcription factor domain family protein [Aspergillus niger]|uniref:1,3-beta-glucanosyltransferase n=1 Tax=Aspergillus niger TaxID=5061 RepID=A0A505ICI3_ASPNG|nr:Fungal specific transcription factor domain family protein [Aspergillus niger]